MKKLYLLTLCSAAFASTLAAETYNIGGGTATQPALFSNADAWGGTLPPFDSTTNVILKGVEGDPQYFNIDQNVTVGSIKTEVGVNGDYYLNASGNKVNIDVAAGSDADAILFSNGQTKTAVGTLSIDNGTFNITSSATSGGDFGTTARIATASDSGISNVTKKIDIGANAVINAYTKLAFNGTAGSYSDINIFGEVNTYATGNKGEGDLIIQWNVNNYENTDKKGGTRTRVNIEDGGVVSTGNMLMKVYAKVNVKEGATLNVNNALKWEYSASNPAGVLSSAGTTYIKSATFAAGSSSDTGAAQINVTGGTTTIGSVSQNYEKSSINVSGGTLNIEDSYDMGTGEFNVSGGTANVKNYNQSAGKLSVTGGSLNLSGTNNIVSKDTISTTASSTLTFKEGSVNTFSGSTATTYNELKGNVNFEKGSTLSVGDRFAITNGTWNFDGNFVNTKTASSNWQALQLGNSSVKFTFGENATYTAGSYNRMWISDSTMIFNSATNSIKTTSFVLGGKSVLQFNKKNSVVSVNDKYETSLNLTVGSKPTLILKDTQQFKDVLFQGINQDASMGDDTTKADTLATLTLDLQFGDNTASYVSFTDWHASYSHADGTPQEFVNVYVKNFENNRIFFTDLAGNNVTINLFDAVSNEKIDYKFDAGTAGGVDGFWLNAVPEPAEWAAIFGAIALGLAIYRRRK